MDLVEIRKKAKSRKTRGKKASEKPQKAAAGPSPAGGSPSAPAEETPPQAFETEAETVITGEEQDMKGSGKISAGAETGDSLSSLKDVLMSQHDEVREEEEEQLQLLTFMLAGEEYALNIMDIKEIIRPKEATEVPRTPDYILGIVSLRGTIIPIFDVSLRLGLPQGERGPQNRIIVVRFQEHLFGLHVDSVIQVLDIPLSRIEPPPEILGGVEGEFLRGIGRIDERLIILLNLSRILKVDEGDNAGRLELPPGRER